MIHEVTLNGVVYLGIEGDQACLGQRLDQEQYDLISWKNFSAESARLSCDVNRKLQMMIS